MSKETESNRSLLAALIKALVPQGESATRISPTRIAALHRILEMCAVHAVAPRKPVAGTTLTTSKKKRTRLTGEVVFADDPDYANDRKDLIELFQSYPYVIVFARGTKDVVNALLWSRENNVTPRVRGGRCSTEGWCNINNGIVIDISQIKFIRVDCCNLIATVGAGMTQGQLTNCLTKTGLYADTGDEARLGMIGVLLGGGIGLLSRRHGPGCYNLLQVKMVIPDGCKGAKVVTADEFHNSDLLWACRGGGGGNLGVVVSYKVKLFVAPKYVVVWQCFFPFDCFPAAFDTWQRWAPTVRDTRLSSKCSLFKRGFEIHGIFLGSEEELGDRLAPIESVPGGECTKEQKLFREWYHIEVTPEEPFQKYSPMWIEKPLPRRALRIVQKFMRRAPSEKSNFFSLAWGGQTRIRPAGGASFPRRGALFYSEPGAEWSDEKINAEALTWVEGFRLALLPYFNGGYVNVLDRSISNYGEEYYGRNFDRLQRIKRKWDPHDVFHFEQSIPIKTDACSNIGVKVCK